MKKILFISPGYVHVINNRGGAIENLMNLFFEYNDRDPKYDITTYTINDKENCESIHFKYTHLREIDISKYGFLTSVWHKVTRCFSIVFGTASARVFVKKVIEDLNKRKELQYYDLIVIENCVNDLAYIGKHLKTKTPIVLHLHNDYLSVKRKDVKRATSFLHEIWCVSNYLKGKVSKIKSCGEKTRVIYNTIKPDLFNKVLTSQQIENKRKELGINKSDFVFIYVGRIMNGKGVLPMLKAFRSFTNEEKKRTIKMIVIGDKKTQGRMDRYYKSCAKEISSCDNIIYINHLNNEDLYQYYQIANCQLIPSKCQEAFGLVALEGKISGLRIISTGNGGLKEVLDKGDYIIKDLKKRTIIDAMKKAANKGSMTRVKPKEVFTLENFNTEIKNRIERITANTSNKKTVMHVIWSLSNGGTEKYLVNLLSSTKDLYNNIVVCYSEKNIWKETLDILGVKVIIMKNNNVNELRGLRAVMKENKVDIVYSYTYYNSAIVMLAAFMAGIKKRITHAHVSENSTRQSLFKIVVSKLLITFFSNEKLACSKNAGKSLYYSHRYKIVPNGIDIDVYRFNESQRKKIRRELGISDSDLVFGTIGRLDENKNQEYMIRVISELRKKINCKLIIVGDGDKKEYLSLLIKKLSLENDVFLLGNRMNGNEYYSAFDAFLLTSYKEGFPYVMLEAQANGLPIFVSSSVCRETKINRNVYFMDLDSGEKAWAETIIKNNKFERQNPSANIKKYSVENVAKAIIKDVYEEAE